jgi:hypothetical protein
MRVSNVTPPFADHFVLKLSFSDLCNRYASRRLQRATNLTGDALDHDTDAIIQNTLRKELGADVTVLTIAHRFQTIVDADSIVSVLLFYSNHGKTNLGNIDGARRWSDRQYPLLQAPLVLILVPRLSSLRRKNCCRGKEASSSRWSTKAQTERRCTSLRGYQLGLPKSRDSRKYYPEMFVFSMYSLLVIVSLVYFCVSFVAKFGDGVGPGSNAIQRRLAERPLELGPTNPEIHPNGGFQGPRTDVQRLSMRVRRRWLALLLTQRAANGPLTAMPLGRRYQSLRHCALRAECVIRLRRSSENEMSGTHRGSLSRREG